jgi:uncharacterized protein DUF6584
MPKPDVLDRVSADLALGHTQPAIQRLSSLVAAHPADLDLRRRLARLHRMVGNRIEAGRWDYLTPGADTAEAAAFERAFPSPSRRLAALRWSPRSEVLLRGATGGPGQLARTSPRTRTSDSSLAATEYARARLESLARAAAVEPARACGSRGNGGWGEDRPAPKAGHRWSARAAKLAAGLAVTFFVVLGAVTVAQWLLP